MTTGIEKVLEIKAEDAGPKIDSSQFDFMSSKELDPLSDIVEQPRALQALKLGLGVTQQGYNIYVSGQNGMGKKELITREVLKTANLKDTPCDWVYLYNFDQDDRPLAISLSAGAGNQFRKEMDNLIDKLVEELPRSFRQEDFVHEKQQLAIQFEKKGREEYERLEKIANEKELLIQEMPDGRILMVPKKDNRPIQPEEFDSLSSNQKDEISLHQQEVGQLASNVINNRQELSMQLREEVRKIEKIFASKIIEPMIANIKSKFVNRKIEAWLDKVQENLLNSLGRFRDQEQMQQQQMAMMFGSVPQDGFIEYRVNVLIDNGNKKGAPIIVEESPNYKNLFGTIHNAVDRTGRIISNHLNIKPGSLLRANGGYLVMSISEALLEPLVWKEIKRALKSGCLEYHTYDPFGVFAVSHLRPEPIPIQVKIIFMGNPLIYHLLEMYDEDFSELFKIKADFSSEMNRRNGTERNIGGLLEKLRQTDKILPFTKDAVAEVIRIGSRLAGEKSKITAEWSKLADIARESSFWASQESSEFVNEIHVQKAIDEKIYRSNLIAEKITELIENGTLLITLDGSKVGQINGLSVVMLGDYMFGRPSRVTASVGIGTSGIINIERESRLSGHSFDKAVLILEGFLRNVFAVKHPISLSASITMEQSYSPIDGDSATMAELISLLSAIAGVPLRQDIAITGSVNQWGEVQAIGGVNEKIEGYYDVCKRIGLTGKQGVCIPKSNEKNLVLHPKVIKALQEGAFHVYTVKHINETIELLTGIPSGYIDEPNTFNWLVDKRLIEIANVLKQQGAMFTERTFAPYQVSGNGSGDPRPKLPGQDKG